ncbi:MAG: prephenate dehydrogenase/arogenate dehydrogenase family protein [Proteobacteria bacterium]|jgi:prephenate dehydrogenase|nr:prephenate dehydrogenase/arogenate dehydrogenase family protein [Pseudomonadota bacterium]MDA0873058.1 prephenate dehydrogenase/arogenate dehydrogenase family protein [Pseudomonadota bacterium]MDA1133525.1 prephenate dehydrogenase/arogenate dehydrogenase family protein [Pseudomonadota bacterium]
MNKILIFGVGLIGGSIALKAKDLRLCKEIVGISRSNGTDLSPFVKSGMLDRASSNYQSEIQSADLIVLATPVAQIEITLEKIYPLLTANTLITDVGSTKTNINQAAKVFLKEKYSQFIGSHPIAGSEKHGPQSAMADLFENKNIIITPHTQSKKEDINKIENFWKKLGGITSIMDANLHDEIFATVSHLPHLLAFSLVNLINDKNNKETMLEYAASGFRDFSRIAGSSAEMWRDICLANKDAILTDLELYKKEIEALSNLIKNNHHEDLLNYFLKASKTRQNWSKD